MTSKLVSGVRNAAAVLLTSLALHSPNNAQLERSILERAAPPKPLTEAISRVGPAIQSADSVQVINNGHAYPLQVGTTYTISLQLVRPPYMDEGGTFSFSFRNKQTAPNGDVSVEMDDIHTFRLYSTPQTPRYWPTDTVTNIIYDSKRAYDTTLSIDFEHIQTMVGIDTNHVGYKPILIDSTFHVGSIEFWGGQFAFVGAPGVAYDILEGSRSLASMVGDTFQYTFNLPTCPNNTFHLSGRNVLDSATNEVIGIPGTASIDLAFGKSLWDVKVGDSIEIACQKWSIEDITLHYNYCSSMNYMTISREGKRLIVHDGDMLDYGNSDRRLAISIPVPYGGPIVLSCRIVNAKTGQPFGYLSYIYTTGPVFFYGIDTTDSGRPVSILIDSADTTKKEGVIEFRQAVELASVSSGQTFDLDSGRISFAQKRIYWARKDSSGYQPFIDSRRMPIRSTGEAITLDLFPAVRFRFNGLVGTGKYPMAQWSIETACDSGFTSVKEIDQNSVWSPHIPIKVYPNPIADGVMNVKLDKPAGKDVKLYLYTPLGQKVEEIPIRAGEQEGRIYLEGLATGTYWLKEERYGLPVVIINK